MAEAEYIVSAAIYMFSIFTPYEVKLNRPDEIHSHGPYNLSLQLYILNSGLYAFNLLFISMHLNFLMVEFQLRHDIKLSGKTLLESKIKMP